MHRLESKTIHNDMLGSANLGKMYFVTKDEIKSLFNHDEVRSITLELLNC